MSKTALEILTQAICVEQTTPSFQCVTLRPGIFETAMQAYMRSRDLAIPSARCFAASRRTGS
jgi:NAD(P)-dependent dehydrogenase (short-subunit alcohol dehydrogenase family)